MALLPMMWDDIYDPRRQLEDIYDLGLGLRDWDLALPTIPAFRPSYLRPWRRLAQAESGVSSIKSDDKEFNVRLDVSHFRPEELKVRLENGYVIVEGQHEERSDEHGFISRQFTRRYKLPDDIVEDTLSSNLSSDGVLTLQATKKPKETQSGREISIVKTNKPALKDESRAPQKKGTKQISKK